MLIILFALFISPVVYCYYLQYNLHPEKVVRGKDHINGVKFILLSQTVERFKGESFGSDAKSDYFFFLHSFLWAFAPWSILAYIAFVTRIKKLFKQKEEWLTMGVFAVMLVLISVSGFKLPHYLNIIFPTTAVMVSAFLLSKQSHPKWIKIIFIIQLTTVTLLLGLDAVINTWAFPVKNVWLIVGVVFLLAIVFYFLKSKNYSPLQKAVIVSVAAMIFSFFLLNSNFYPQLLTYQGGNELAFGTKEKVGPENVWFWKNNYSSSYNFYTATIRKEFSDSILQPGKKIWLLTDIRNMDEIKSRGYLLGKSYSVLDYEITKLDIKFINPAKREQQCTKMVLVELLGKK